MMKARPTSPTMNQTPTPMIRTMTRASVLLGGRPPARAAAAASAAESGTSASAAAAQAQPAETMEGAECADDYNEREQAVIMYDEDNNVTVIQPNEDGSYWRKIVRNKIARMKERRRELAALEFLKFDLGVDENAAKEHVKSSWGPYVTTSGVAKSTNAKEQIK